MNKQATRAFASGLLLSALFLFGYQQFFYTKPTTQKTGYIEVKKSEYNDIKKDNQMWEEKFNQLNAQKTNPEKQNESPKETITKYHLKISEGMTPDEVSSSLKSGGIITDDEKFLRFLIDKKYEEKVQIGEYDLNSKMDYTQIAKVITKNR